MNMYFSEYFEVELADLENYGAFNISVVSDMPLFVDPFLMFNSEKEQYKTLHGQMIDYLKFLRDHSMANPSDDFLRNLYCFKEVKQNWLGFTLFGNEGSGLGINFARTLNESLGTILSEFGEEEVTEGTHLEKLALIKSGVGRDNISDFTTNLIKDYLLEYTQEFASNYINDEKCSTFAVERSKFNYLTETWETRSYYLPRLRSDFVLLTPMDILARDDTWINKTDLIRVALNLPASIEDGPLRERVNNYFWKKLKPTSTAKERRQVGLDAIQEFPELIDYYIKAKELNGDQASNVSQLKVEDVRKFFGDEVRRAIRDIQERSNFYDQPWTSLDEALQRVLVFKDYVENKDGYRLINRQGKGFSREEDVQLFFGLLWCMTEFDVNREPNNGRGPVDFKVSFGSSDKSLIEFKLGSNTQLKRNLQNQVEIYQKANDTKKSVKVIVCYTRQQESKVSKILKALDLIGNRYVVVIDARNDNKPSASKA